MHRPPAPMPLPRLPPLTHDTREQPACRHGPSTHARSACPGNTVFCIWQPCARDSGNKIAASAHDMGSGGLAFEAMAIGCLGVERRGERFFVLSHFRPFYSSVQAAAQSNTTRVRSMLCGRHPPSHAGRGEYSGSVFLSDTPSPPREVQTPADSGVRQPQMDDGPHPTSGRRPRFCFCNNKRTIDRSRAFLSTPASESGGLSAMVHSLRAQRSRAEDTHRSLVID